MRDDWDESGLEPTGRAAGDGVYGSAWVTEADHVDARRTDEVVDEIVEEQTKPLGLWADTWRRLKRNKIALVGLGIIIVFLCVGAIETVFYQAKWHVRASADTKANPQSPGLPRARTIPTRSTTPCRPQGIGSPPSWSHPFGTDFLGRDVLSRTLIATRIAMLVGVIAVAIALTLGLLLGPVSGYYGGAVDSVIMRAADIFFAFPYILFVLLIMSVLGQGFQNVFIAIGVLGWATFARVVRGQILSVKSMEYVEAARAQGAGDLRIIFRHVLPNSMAPVYVAVAMAIGGAIATEAALSYLGIGVQPPNSSWGLMISDSVDYLAVGQLVVAAVPQPRPGGHGLRLHLVRQRPARRDRPQAQGIGDGRAPSHGQGPLDALLHARRRGQGGQRRQLHARPRRDPRHRGRVRLGQDGRGPVAHAAHPRPARQGGRGLAHARRPRPAHHRATTRCAACAATTSR